MATGMKTGGRKAGTPNKLTKELRSILKEIIEQELEGLPERIKGLDDNERIQILIKLIPCALPKIRTVHYTENEPLDFRIE